MKKILQLFLVIVLTLSLTGCGYSTRSLLPSNLKAIYIEPFKNKVSYIDESIRNLYLPLLEVKVTNAVVDRFLFDGNLDIKDADQADLILKGELLNFERHPLRYIENTEDVEEYRINIVVSLVLWDTQDEEVVWEEPSFVGDTTYFTTGTLTKSEATAVEDALVDLARRVVERTIENW